jgi:hypothetical protein
VRENFWMRSPSVIAKVEADVPPPVLY